MSYKKGKSWIYMLFILFYYNIKIEFLFYYNIKKEQREREKWRS